MAVRKKIDILFDIALPIVFDDSFSLFKYSSFSIGYHFEKERWQPIMGDDFLHCEEELKKNRAMSTASMQLQ